MKKQTPQGGEAMEFKFLKDKLKQLRKDKNLNIDELGEKIDMSRSGIGDIESGKNDPRFKTVQALSEFFDINPIEFFISGEIAKNILPKNLDDETINFMLDGQNNEYLKIIVNAKKNNITPAQLNFYMTMELSRKELEK